MTPKPGDPCGNCSHRFDEHAPDTMTPKNRCWHGAATGNSCEHQCKDFVAKG